MRLPKSLHTALRLRSVYARKGTSCPGGRARQSAVIRSVLRIRRLEPLGVVEIRVRRRRSRMGGERWTLHDHYVEYGEQEENLEFTCPFSGVLRRGGTKSRGVIGLASERLSRCSGGSKGGCSPCSTRPCKTGGPARGSAPAAQVKRGASDPPCAPRCAGDVGTRGVPTHRRALAARRRTRGWETRLVKTSDPRRGVRLGS
jgi:hypothetical protein